MANRNSRRAGRPKGYPKTGGRKAGTRNRVTVEAKAAAAEIVDNPAYRRSLMARAISGELGAMEVPLWHYAKGRPVDDAVPAVQVLSLMRGITDLFLELVPDVHLRRQFAHGLRRRIPVGADFQIDVESVSVAEPEEFQL